RLPHAPQPHRVSRVSRAHRAAPWSRCCAVLLAAGGLQAVDAQMRPPQGGGGGALAEAGEAGADQRLAIPPLEIVGFDFLLSNFNRAVSGSSDYRVTASSIGRNLRGPWVTDNDPFRVNQFLHPYQGSLYHGAGRAAGLSYWEASALTFAGSAWW